MACASEERRMQRAGSAAARLRLAAISDQPASARRAAGEGGGRWTKREASMSTVATHSDNTSMATAQQQRRSGPMATDTDGRAV